MATPVDLRFVVPATGQEFLVRVDPSSTVAAVKADLAARLGGGAHADALRLSCGGVAWADDGDAVGAHRPLAFSVVTVTVAVPDFITADEGPRAVVVQGIPHADAAATEAALLAAFAPHGGITRMMFQDDAGGQQQRAVIVFEDEDDAAAAEALLRTARAASARGCSSWRT